MGATSIDIMTEIKASSHHPGKQKGKGRKYNVRVYLFAESMCFVK